MRLVPIWFEARKVRTGDHRFIDACFEPRTRQTATNLWEELGRPDLRGALFPLPSRAEIFITQDDVYRGIQIVCPAPELFSFLCWFIGAVAVFLGTGAMWKRFLGPVALSVDAIRSRGPKSDRFSATVSLGQANQGHLFGARGTRRWMQC